MEGKPINCDGSNDLEFESFAINEHCLMYMIKTTEYPAELNARMLQKNDNENDSDKDTNNNTDDKE